MTDKDKVTQIVAKYNGSISELSQKATAKEFKTVFKYVADEANKLQRRTAGLDK